MIPKRPAKRAFSGLVGLPPEPDATPAPGPVLVKRGRPPLDESARAAAKKKAQGKWRENQKAKDPDFLKNDAKRKQRENRERKWYGPKQRPRTRASWADEAKRAEENMRRAKVEGNAPRSIKKLPPALRDHNHHDTTGLYIKDAPSGKGAFVFRPGAGLEEIFKQKTGSGLLHLPSEINLTDTELQVRIDKAIAEAKSRGDHALVHTMENMSVDEWRDGVLAEYERESGQVNGGRRTKVPVLMDRAETLDGEETPDVRKSRKPTFIGEENESYEGENDRAIRYSVSRYTTTVQLGDQRFRFVYLSQNEVENHIGDFVHEHIEDAAPSEPTGFDERGEVIMSPPSPVVCLDCGETIHHEFPAWASKRTRVAAPHFIGKHRKALVAYIREQEPRAFRP